MQLGLSPKQKRLHDPAQRNPLDLQKKVDVVLHQCIGIDTERKSGFAMGNVRNEPLQIPFMPKYALPAVPSADYMVECTGKMYPRTTSHTGNVSKSDTSVNTKLPKPHPLIFSCD
jgi:hypothetical protein